MGFKRVLTITYLILSLYFLDTCSFVLFSDEGKIAIFNFEIVDRIWGPNQFNRNTKTLFQECSHIINPVDDFFACDEDRNSFETFNIDLAVLEIQLIGNQTGLTVTYHDPGGSLIDFSIGNQDVVNRRGILARATDASGCVRETLFNLILRTPPAVPVFTDVRVCDAYTLPMLPGNGTYFTSPSGLGTQRLPGEIITNSQRLYIYDAVGDCSSESSFRIIIDASLCPEEPVIPTLVDFPKFFTPNGDTINEFWQYIPNPEAPLTIINIQIFDRFGRLITQLDPTSQGWDGTFNGRPMPASDYWFKAVDSNQLEYTGHFSLKR